MTEIWTNTLTFAAAVASYGDAQAARSSRRGSLGRISGTRTGAFSGIVTVQIYADVDLTNLIGEAELVLAGAGSVDVAAPDTPLPFRCASATGLYVRIKDSADAADTISIHLAGEAAQGA